MESIKDMLLDPLKGKNQAQNILTFLFREVLLWRKVTLRLWNKKVESFFERPYNKDYQDRGNFNKAIKSNEMQWPTFKRGMDVLEPSSAVMTLKLTFADHVSEYSFILDPEEDEVALNVNSLPWQDCKIFTRSKPAENLLTHLIRHIYADQSKGVKSETKWFNNKVQEFIQEPRNVMGFDEKELSSFQSTLKKDVTDPRLTWNKLRRAIHVLKPLKEEYTLTLSWPVTSHLVKPLPDTVIKIEITDPHLVKP